MGKSCQPAQQWGPPWESADVCREVGSSPRSGLCPAHAGGQERRQSLPDIITPRGERLPGFCALIPWSWVLADPAPPKVLEEAGRATRGPAPGTGEVLGLKALFLARDGHSFHAPLSPRPSQQRPFTMSRGSTAKSLRYQTIPPKIPPECAHI